MDETRLQLTIERAREYDPDAWESLYRRAYPRLFAYARRRVPSAHEADDAVSEAFARAMGAIHGFTSSRAGFDGWLYGILRNVLLEHYRADRRGAQGPLPGPDAGEPASEEPQPLDHVLARERADAVRRAFDELPPGERELLELRVLGELDAKAVGAVVGKRSGAVRMAQARALKRLHSVLGEVIR